VSSRSHGATASTPARVCAGSTAPRADILRPSCARVDLNLS
jgi:hypothetical protein